MKQIIVVFFLFAAIAAHGQRGSGFGLKGGLNLSTISTDNETTMANTLGYHIGVQGRLALGAIALQPEVTYSSQGGKYTVNNEEHKLELNYVNIPLLVQYVFPEGFILETGPQLGLLVGAKDKLRGTETGFFTSEDFKKTDISWAIGMGYQTRAGLGFDLRYNLGMTNINAVGSSNLKNGVAQLGLFYMLR